MLKTILIVLLPVLALFSVVANRSLTETNATTTAATPGGETGTMEKMIVAEGNVTMDLDLIKLNGPRVARNAKAATSGQLRFDVPKDSFFKILVVNNELRGPVPSSMPLAPQNSIALPTKLDASVRQLVVESMPFGDGYELQVRDARSGFVFFGIEGTLLDYDGETGVLSMMDGRLRISKDFAAALGRPGDAGTVAGTISITAKMRAIEVANITDGDVKNEVLPGISPEVGGVPGPDVIVGDLVNLGQFGSATATQVGLAVGTDSCNNGVENLHWFQNPQNDHPVIPQNLYRLSGGGGNDERFEQIGQSQVKHAFLALTENICGFGCNGVGNTNLGSGCSDPYSANLNSGPSLGSRAFINPFTGLYPRGDDPVTPNNSHGGHTNHSGPGHRILTNISDLNTTLNPGAGYFTEAQYITPHEYQWCQTHPGQCNMYNNVSYRRYNVTGTTGPFSFSPAGTTVRTKPAFEGWPGATSVEMRPAPGVDGIAFLVYKITQTSPGTWHYEYAVYNQNLDRSIQSFSIPVGDGVTLSNIGFHAPPQHPGISNDGTFNNLGFSSTPWTGTQAGGAITWATETLAQNQNANAIRWGTMYNFRFDSNRPPASMNATVGFYKTGSPITVAVQGPESAVVVNVSISGRVATAGGLPIRSANVILDDLAGNTQRIVTGSFGTYGFENLTPGHTYEISVNAKRYRFTARQSTPTENVTDFDFIPNPD